MGYDGPTEILSEIPDPSFWEDYADGPICLVLEDYEIQNKYDKKALSDLFRWCSSHIGINGITVYLLYQELYRVPVIARRCADVWVLWPFKDKVSQQTVEKMIDLEKGELQKLFNLCKGSQDSIMFDKTPKTPYPIRLNLFTNISKVHKIEGKEDEVEDKVY